jgi:uncharacterized protein (UPF0305 family)
LRLNLPLEKCFLIFIQRQHKLKQEENEASDFENDNENDHNEDEELEDLEDDYAKGSQINFFQLISIFGLES